MTNKIIEKTVAFVKDTLENAEGCHDWFHIYRVWNNAKNIGKGENVNMFVVELGALLHDIAEPKFHNGDETIGPRVAGEFLGQLGVDKQTIEHVQNIIKHVSFKNTFSVDGEKFTSPELQVVQDADRLDALGAIGIARTFNYGGTKNRSLYDPEIESNLNMTKEEYKNSDAPSINHFYEKLLLLKDKMNTKTGKQVAINRHEFMKTYLDQFFGEWEGEL